MNHALPEPVRYCALADLLLLCCDLLRRPEAAGAAVLASRDDFAAPLEAAGVPPGDPLKLWFEELLRHLEETSVDSWTDDYHRLFDGGVLCPLNQTAYVRRDKGAILGDLCGFYRAFGFTPSGGSGEKPDHLLTQMEFLAILLVMLSQAEGEQKTVTRKAITSLAEAHLCEWIGAVWERVASNARVPYYVTACAFAQSWKHLSRQLGFPPLEGNASFESPPDEEFECGACPSTLETATVAK